MNASEPVVGKKGGRIMSLSDPTAKMSKSAGESHYVGVMEPETSIRKKVRSAVTDLGLETSDTTSPGIANLFEVLELSTEATGQAGLVEELRADFAAGTFMYSKLKDTVFEQLMEILRPIQQRRTELEASGDVIDMLRSEANKARAIAGETMAQVRSIRNRRSLASVTGKIERSKNKHLALRRLTIAEIEINALIRQCLDRRIDTLDEMRAATHDWEKHRTALNRASTGGSPVMTPTSS